MSLFTKIVTAVRGSVRELGEVVLDANGTRIYEQEIVDARHALGQAKQDLTLVMAKEMQAGREITRLQAEIARYEGHGGAALDKGEARLVEDVADRLLALDTQLAAQSQARAEFAASIARLKALITQAEAKLREHERELLMAKTTESVHRATQSISQSVVGGGGKLLSAKESLERIKQRQQDMADRMHASTLLDEELGELSLERRLAAAGIGEQVANREAVLARMAARRKAGEGGEGGEADHA